MFGDITRLSTLLYRTRVGTRSELFRTVWDMRGTGGAVYTVNPTILMGALGNEELYEALLRGVCIPDGVGIRRALSGLFIESEVLPGVELGEELLSLGVSFAIVGGVKGRASAAAERLCEKNPTSRCVMAEDGYFTDSDAMRDKLLSCDAEVVFICLGSPRQELFIDELIRAGGRSLYIALGGSVDVYSGALRRAPSVFRALSLEWVWRMLRQPKRLRGLPTLLKFARLSHAAAHILKKSGKSISQIT